MKRATLTSYPTNQPSHPADLTDRLLAPESAQPAAPAKKRRAARARPASPAASAPETATEQPRELPPSNAALPHPAKPDALAESLAAADAAVASLRSAGALAPARYDVALRYRLDALAYHLQQVKEFVTSLASR